MPRIIVDGKEIEVAADRTIIQACDEAGIDIPRYCYHPGLSVAGNCRICLVEVEKRPKLEIACNTRVTSGMVVHTKSKAVKEARRGVLEFLLINHPLDCPVCDQSGECRLQDYYMQYGQYDSRFIENKIKKHKAQPIGAHVLLDTERCILCTRCVRFTDEITKTHELGIVNRGDREELVLGEGKELNNNYSGNTVDICPVGALTDRDFRFQTRVWYLSSTPSVCPGCSMGCNIDIHSNRTRPYKAGGRRVARLKPRYNPDVNQWWMCDVGRYGFASIDAPNRIQNAFERHANTTHALDIDEAVRAAADRLAPFTESQTAGVLVSSTLTTEELYLAHELFRKHLGIKKVFAYPLNPAGDADGFLLKSDRNPNTAALGLFGFKTISAKALEGELEKSGLKALYVMGHDLEMLLGPKALAALDALELIVFQGTHENSTSARAHIVLAGATPAEKDGTFINDQARIQLIQKAVPPIGEAAQDWEILFKLGARLGAGLGDLRTPGEIFKKLAQETSTLKGLTYDAIGPGGHKIKDEQLVGA